MLVAYRIKREIFGEFINLQNSIKLIIMNGEYNHLIKIGNTKLRDLLLFFQLRFVLFQVTDLFAFF